MNKVTNHKIILTTGMAMKNCVNNLLNSLWFIVIMDLKQKLNTYYLSNDSNKAVKEFYDSMEVAWICAYFGESEPSGKAVDGFEI